MSETKFIEKELVLRLPMYFAYTEDRHKVEQIIEDFAKEVQNLHYDEGRFSLYVEMIQDAADQHVKRSLRDALRSHFEKQGHTYPAASDLGEACRERTGINATVFGDPRITSGDPTPQHLRTTVVERYEIVGNQFLAIAVNMDKPEDVHYFDIDPEVNNDAFVRACGWAYEPLD